MTHEDDRGTARDDRCPGSGEFATTERKPRADEEMIGRCPHCDSVLALGYGGRVPEHAPSSDSGETDEPSAI